MKKRGLPLLRLAEVIGPTEVRLFFSDGSVVERSLPGIRRLRRVRVVDGGLGMDPGDGKGEMSARMLHLPCKRRRVYDMSY